jgi:hypothetical protein
MSEESMMDSIIRSVSLEKIRIQPEAYRALTESLKAVLEDLRRTGFISGPHFKQNFEKMAERPGLLDAWLTLILLTSVAGGIAVGQGQDHITPEIVIRARMALCDKWPKCGVMKIEAFRRALSTLMEWYDAHFEER